MSNRIVVRPARSSEVEELWKLVTELAVYEKLEHCFTGSAEALANSLFGERGWPPIGAFVAEDRGALVGYAIYFGGFSSFRTKPLVWLEDLFVTETRRGEGIGRRLLAAVARVAVARGALRVDWAVLDWNQPSIDFYERLGATRQGGWFNYRIEGEALAKLAVTG